MALANRDGVGVLRRVAVRDGHAAPRPGRPPGGTRTESPKHGPPMARRTGEARLLDAVRTHRSLSALELATRIVNDVKAFSPLEQSDDWTLIAAIAR